MFSFNELGYAIACQFFASEKVFTTIGNLLSQLCSVPLAEHVQCAPVGGETVNKGRRVFGHTLILARKRPLAEASHESY
jgi:hypothetical protein